MISKRHFVYKALANHFACQGLIFNLKDMKIRDLNDNVLGQIANVKIIDAERGMIECDFKPVKTVRHIPLELEFDEKDIKK